MPQNLKRLHAFGERDWFPNEGTTACDPMLESPAARQAAMAPAPAQNTLHGYTLHDDFMRFAEVVWKDAFDLCKRNS